MNSPRFTLFGDDVVRCKY